MGGELYLLDRKIWRKSFLIEIIHANGQADCIGFSLPPEGIEITIPQRVSETKTYGGIFTDDYGVDIGKIHLSGSTGNSCVKEIYSGKYEKYSAGANASGSYTGREEIYYLRDKLARYKTTDAMERTNKTVCNLSV
jgi:hypothetical protein